MRRVGLIFGGQSDERFVSQKSAQAIRKFIDKKKYRVTEIEVTPESRSIGELIQKIQKIDLALLVLHGPGGEDGKIQTLLDLYRVPYTSSGPIACAIAMNKSTAKQFAKDAGLWVTASRLYKKGEMLPKFVSRCVVKPNNIGSSLGVSIVTKPRELSAAFKKAFKYNHEVLVEKFLSGREFTVPVIGAKVMPVVEIIPNHSKFFDYEAKYTQDGSQEIVPARLTATQTKQIQASALAIHRALGCKGLTRSDFILSGGKFYFLEINTIPGMTETSLAPKSAAAAGLNFTKFIDLLIKSA